MLYVQNFNCAFVSVIGEVKTIEKLTEANLEEAHLQPNATWGEANIMGTIDKMSECQLSFFEHEASICTRSVIKFILRHLGHLVT